MWKVFVVPLLSWRRRKRCGNFKDQEMDCVTCKKIVGEGGESLRERCGNFKDQEMDCGTCKKIVGEG
nr:hypothetical protein [Tanacetum cinerariifolium]